MQFQQVAFLHVRNGLAYEAGLTPVDSSMKDTKVKCYQEYTLRGLAVPVWLKIDFTPALTRGREKSVEMNQPVK